MKIVLNRKNKACHLLATNDDGNIISIDGAPQLGGENLGFRPMQLLAAGAGSCSSMDIISILTKQRQKLDDFQVIVEAEREQNVVPALFSDIHLHFVLTGDLDEDKVKKAIQLSMEKYCSVVKILEKTARITYSYLINSN
jgi:uncharacterized OsmC-like protein